MRIKMSNKVSEVAQRCIELAEVIKDSVCKFHMGMYMHIDGISTRPPKAVYDKTINECETGACVAGHIPLSHLELVVLSYDGSIDSGKTSFNFLQTESSDSLWKFLFSQVWSDDKEQAIKRLLYVAENRTIHPDFFVYDVANGCYSKYKLVLE